MRLKENTFHAIYHDVFHTNKVLYISNGCCTQFIIYYFILHLFYIINDTIFNLMMLIQSGILLKNHASCN